MLFFYRFYLVKIRKQYRIYLTAIKSSKSDRLQLFVFVMHLLKMNNFNSVFFFSRYVYVLHQKKNEFYGFFYYSICLLHLIFESHRQ